MLEHLVVIDQIFMVWESAAAVRLRGARRFARQRRVQGLSPAALTKHDPNIYCSSDERAAILYSADRAYRDA